VGIIYPAIEGFFRLLEYITLLGLIKYVFVRRLHFRWYALYSLLAVDLYILFWFAAELAVFSYPFTSLVIPRVFSFILLWRILDIVQAWFNTMVRPPHWSSPPRALTLVLLNYAEIILIFTVIIFSFQDSFFHGPVYMYNALFSSISIIVPMVDPVVTPFTITGIVIYYGEIALGLIFILVVIQRVVALFSK
jgi:hypothetical protein